MHGIKRNQTLFTVLVTVYVEVDTHTTKKLFSLNWLSRHFPQVLLIQLRLKLSLLWLSDPLNISSNILNSSGLLKVLAKVVLQRITNSLLNCKLLLLITIKKMLHVSLKSTNMYFLNKKRAIFVALCSTRIIYSKHITKEGLERQRSFQALNFSAWV